MEEVGLIKNPSYINQNCSIELLS